MGIHKNILDTLKERGLLDAVTNKEALYKRAEKPLSLYIGFDPTAESLHLGNLLGIIVLRWFQMHGHTPVVLLGGATARIGDPSGKSVERPLLNDEEIEHNVRSIEKHFRTILDFNDEKTMPHILNNDTWYRNLSVVDFMRTVGKHFRVGAMMGKESVRSRIDSDEGMSFTEFSYQIFQGNDFYHLRREAGVILQMGGSDQWGNITAGTELNRRLSQDEEDAHVYGATFPLLLRSDGKKFGKTESGAVWLSSDKYSPYQFYQYLFTTLDSDVIKMMRMLTFMPMKEIAEIEATMADSPNSAQARLAEEVTRIVHGEEGVRLAQRVTEALAPGSSAPLDVELFDAIGEAMPRKEFTRGEIEGRKFVDVLHASALVSSRSEALRLVSSGGAYMNNQKVGDHDFVIDSSALIGEKYVLLAAGKKKKCVCALV